MADEDRPHAWRARAAEIRNIAEQVGDIVIRQQFMELAETWEQMALRVERQMRADVIRLRS